MSDAGTTGQSPLQPEAALWQETKTADGASYWYHRVTKQTTWDKPQELYSPEDAMLDAFEWRKTLDKASGKSYYYNKNTKETTWTMPPAYKDMMDKMDAAKNKRSDPFSNVQVLSMPQRPLADKPALPDPEFGSKEAAIDSFESMLEQMGVDRSWSWERVFRACVDQQMWRALKSAQERKEAWEAWQIAPRAERARAELERTEKRKAVQLLLKSSTRVDGDMTYASANIEFGDHPQWKAIDNEEERKHLYAEFIHQFRTNEIAELRQVRRRSMQLMTKLLRAMPDVTVSSSWREVQPRLESTEEYSRNIDLIRLEKGEVLDFFEEHIHHLERERIEKLDAARTARRRQERVHREAFRHYLRDLVRDRKLRRRTLWVDLKEEVMASDAFQQMVGQEGSTPLDMIRDEQYVLDRQYQAMKGVLRDVLDGKLGKKRCTVLDFTDAQAFVAYVRKEAASLLEKYHNDDIGEFYEDQKKRAQEEAEDEKKRQERKMKRRIDDVKDMLRHTTPPFPSTATYEEIDAFYKDSRRWRAVESESMRRTIVEKYLCRRKEKEAEAADKKELESGEEPDDEDTAANSTSHKSRRESSARSVSRNIKEARDRSSSPPRKRVHEDR